GPLTQWREPGPAAAGPAGRGGDECGAGRLVDGLHHLPGPPVRHAQLPSGRGDAPPGPDLLEQLEPAPAQDGLPPPPRPDADPDRPVLARSGHDLTRRRPRVAGNPHPTRTAMV